MRCPCGCHRGDICRPMSGAVSVGAKFHKHLSSGLICASLHLAPDAEPTVPVHILTDDELAARVASAAAENAELRSRIDEVRTLLADEPMFVSGIRRSIEKNTDGFGRGGDITHTPRPGRRGSGSCPGDNLTEWLDRISAVLAPAHDEGSE